MICSSSPRMDHLALSLYFRLFLTGLEGEQFNSLQRAREGAREGGREGAAGRIQSM